MGRRAEESARVRQRLREVFGGGTSEDWLPTEGRTLPTEGRTLPAEGRTLPRGTAVPDAARPPAAEPSVPGGPERIPPAAAFDPGRRGLRALAAVAAVVVAVAAVLAWQARPRLESVTASQTSPSSSAEPLPSPTGIVVVAVSGRVRRPGLVRLPTGARVADAIEAAGGALPDTDLSLVNLARKVTDGELIVVGIGAAGAVPPPGPGAGPAGGGKVNLNTATLAELDALPGVGPVLAQRIIDYRERRGGFRSVNELNQVDGIGDARFQELKDLVTV